MDALKDVVRSILIYYVVLTVIMSLIGDSAYKKYIQMFTGLVLILIILNPIIRLLKVDSILDHQIQKNQLYELSAAQSQDIMVAELNQQDVLMEQYKDTIKEEVKSELLRHNLSAETIQVEVVDKFDGNQFGEIKNIEVEYKKEGAKEEKEKTQESNEEEEYIVKEVEIPVVHIGNQETVKEKVKTDENTKEVVKSLATSFGISVDQITMHLVKERKE